MIMLLVIGLFMSALVVLWLISLYLDTQPPEARSEKRQDD